MWNGSFTPKGWKPAEVEAQNTLKPTHKLTHVEPEEHRQILYDKA
jgi:hypothetical protein